MINAHWLQHARFGRALLAALFLSPGLLGPVSLNGVQAAPPQPQARARMLCQYTPVPLDFFPKISGNGQFAVHNGYVDMGPNSPGTSSVYLVYNFATHQDEDISLAWDGRRLYNDDSYASPEDISADGRYATFFSDAAGLLPQYPQRINYQLYLRDRHTNALDLITRAGDTPGNEGGENPFITDDGRYVVFQSWSTNLVPGVTRSNFYVYLRDRLLDKNEVVSIASDGSLGYDSTDYWTSTLAISNDGRYVAFPYQQLKGNTGLDRSGVFLRDRQEQKTYFIGSGWDPVLTPDGRYLVFLALGDLAPGDENFGPDLTLIDLQTNSFELISVASDGYHAPGDYRYSPAAITPDGRYVVFASNNPTLADNISDNNNSMDIFVRDRVTQTTRLLTITEDGLSANGDSTNPSISADGRRILFTSGATNLVRDVTEPTAYLCDRLPQGYATGMQVFLPVIGR